MMAYNPVTTLTTVRHFFSRQIYIWTWSISAAEPLATYTLTYQRVSALGVAIQDGTALIVMDEMGVGSYTENIGGTGLGVSHPTGGSTLVFTSRPPPLPPPPPDGLYLFMDINADGNPATVVLQDQMALVLRLTLKWGRAEAGHLSIVVPPGYAGHP